VGEAGGGCPRGRGWHGCLCWRDPLASPSLKHLGLCPELEPQESVGPLPGRVSGEALGGPPASQPSAAHLRMYSSSPLLTRGPSLSLTLKHFNLSLSPRLAHQLQDPEPQFTPNLAVSGSSNEDGVWRVVKHSLLSLAKEGRISRGNHLGGLSIYFI
jgi:hypothetical protein